MKAILFCFVGLIFSLASHATTYGPVENFDVVNDTGKTAHGFEIELDDLRQSEITSIFGDASRWPNMERYGAPTVYEYSDANATRTGKSVKITYRGTYNGGWDVGTPSGTLPVSPSDSCWPYGAPDYGPTYPCDHFGVSTSAQAASVKYSWLLEATPGSSNLVYQDSGVPAPHWTVVPQPPINNVPQPPKVNVVIAAPKPQQYEFGEARWVKVTATGTLKDVGVEDLMAEGDVLQPKNTQTLVEWQLLQTDTGNPQAGQIDLTGVALDSGATGVVYRFEFYKYIGAHDPETYEAKPKTSDTPQQPDPADLGQFVVAQMAGVNFDGQIPDLPPPPVAPAINASIPDAVLNEAYSAKIDASTADPADVLSYSVTGLPMGLSVDPNTGIISGQVTDAGLVGQSFTLNITVEDKTNRTNTAVSTPLAVVVGTITVPTVDQTGTVGQAFAYNLSATGGAGGYEYYFLGTPPEWLSLDALTGVLSGTPSIAGTSAITFYVVDSLGYTSDVISLNLTINEAGVAPPAAQACSGTHEVITNAANVQGAILETKGGPGVPGGASIKIAPATTTIAPPLTTDTFFNVGNLITYRGTLSQGICLSEATSVAQGLTVATIPAQTVNYGATISIPVLVAGGIAPYTISVGNLPMGVSLDGANIVGPATTAGTSSLTVSVNDSNGQSSYQTVSFTVTPPPAIVLGTDNVPTSGQVGSGYTGSVSASGGYGSLTWSGSGLPTGVTLSSGGALSGTPGTAGTYNAVLTVTDGSGQSKAIAKTITINPPPAIVLGTTNLPKGLAGSAYSGSVPASGGVGALSWSATGLPAGLTVSTTTGVVTGTPTTGGTYAVVVTIKDSIGQSKTVNASIAVGDFTLATSAASQTVKRGSSVSNTVTVGALGGFTSNVALSVTGLPKNASAVFANNKATITLLAPGSTTLTVKAASSTPIGTYTLTITAKSGSLVRTKTVSFIVQ